jgi:hypothetical protein
MAQGFEHECTPTGTWFGGGETSAKYLLTIIPIRPGHYLLRYDEGFTPAIPKLSEWSGELVQGRDDAYLGHAIALANTSNVPPNQGGPNPQIWAVREHVRLTDCNTLEAEIDFYGVYVWGKSPFLDTPDGSRLPPGGTIKETYQRMARHCPVCDADTGE